MKDAWLGKPTKWPLLAASWMGTDSGRGLQGKITLERVEEKKRYWLSLGNEHSKLLPSWHAVYVSRSCISIWFLSGLAIAAGICTVSSLQRERQLLPPSLLPENNVGHFRTHRRRAKNPQAPFVASNSHLQIVKSQLDKIKSLFLSREVVRFGCITLGPERDIKTGPAAMDVLLYCSTVSADTNTNIASLK